MQLMVFDLDHTLLSVNSSYAFGSYLYRQGQTSIFSISYCVGYYALHKLGALSVPTLHEKTFNCLFKGKSLNELQKNVGQFLDDHLNGILYLPAIERLKDAQQQGIQVVVLSSSPDFIVGPIANRLGVSQWESTRYAVDKDECLCGISHVMQGKDKAVFLMDLSAKLKIPKEKIQVFTDSYLDLPLMEVAGEVIGVNPDRKLRSLCMQQGWAII